MTYSTCTANIQRIYRRYTADIQQKIYGRYTEEDIQYLYSRRYTILIQQKIYSTYTAEDIQYLYSRRYAVLIQQICSTYTAYITVHIYLNMYWVIYWCGMVWCASNFNILAMGSTFASQYLPNLRMTVCRASDIAKSNAFSPVSWSCVRFPHGHLWYEVDCLIRRMFM